MENRRRNEKQSVVMDGSAAENAPNAVLQTKTGNPVRKKQEIFVRFFAFVQCGSELIQENQQNECACEGQY